MPEGWTIDTLRIYLESLIAALTQLLEERHRAQQEVAGYLIASTEKRLDALDDFRRQLADLAATFITQAEADGVHARFSATHAELWTAVRLCIPRAEYDAAHRRLTEQVTEMSHRIDRAEGRTTGVSVGWAYLVAAISMIGAIVSVYIAINHL